MCTSAVYLTRQESSHVYECSISQLATRVSMCTSAVHLNSPREFPCVRVQYITTRHESSHVYECSISQLATRVPMCTSAVYHNSPREFPCVRVHHTHLVMHGSNHSQEKSVINLKTALRNKGLADNVQHRRA